MTHPMVGVEAESGARARTRRAILDAAVQTFGSRPSASMGEIADAARVGRSTLHRYFPERADLVQSLARYVLTLVDEAIARARPDTGAPDEALRRLAEQMFDVGPIMTFLYSDPQLAKDADFWATMNAPSENDPVVAVVDRAPDRLCPGLTPGWARRVFWSLMYTAWETAREDGTPRHEVIDALMTTFTQGVLTTPARVSGS